MIPIPASAFVASRIVGRLTPRRRDSSLSLGSSSPAFSPLVAMYIWIYSPTWSDTRTCRSGSSREVFGSVMRANKAQGISTCQNARQVDSVNRRSYRPLAHKQQKRSVAPLKRRQRFKQQLRGGIDDCISQIANGCRGD